MQANIPFEDIRLTPEEWATFKPKTPHGGLPVLEIDGKLLAGRGPIQRYLAEEYGLAGTNALENAEIASNYDVIEDLVHRIMLYVHEKDETRKAELKIDLIEKTLHEISGNHGEEDRRKWNTRRVDLRSKCDLSRFLPHCCG